MERLESFHAYLKDFQHQAGILAEAVVSLSKSFEVEADRLTREDGVQRLKEIQAKVVKELERLRRQESASSYASAKVNLPFSLAGLAAKFIMAGTTEKPWALKLVSQVSDMVAEEKRPYGAVMVCVGPKGLPDDVQVVSISELARESNQPESETIQKLQKNGYLLFNQETFLRLIDKLAVDVREGRLYLPISIETLIRAETLRLEARKAEWVQLPRPQ